MSHLMTKYPDPHLRTAISSCLDSIMGKEGFEALGIVSKVSLTPRPIRISSRDYCTRFRTPTNGGAGIPAATFALRIPDPNRVRDLRHR